MPDAGLDLKALFCEWLTTQALDLMKKGSKLAFAYSKALDSVWKQPDSITSAAQLKKVSYVGDKTFQFLCNKLKVHCQEAAIDFPPGFESFMVERQAERRKLEIDDDSPKKKRKIRNWVPKRRSGAWAILVSLHTKDKTRKGMRKEDVIVAATPHCDASFTSNPSARDFYLAWDGIKTLLKRELVHCIGRAPKVYVLTDAGLAMAQAILQHEDIASSPLHEHEMSFDNGVRATPGAAGTETANSSGLLSSSLRLFVPTETPSSPLKHKLVAARELHDVENRVLDGVRYDIWLPEDFTIVVLVDNREIRSQSERDYFQRRIASQGITCEVRALSVGDVLWVARHTKTKREVVLNYVCERKRIDDLALSIRDGRFAEQKNRLKKSGIRNIYYIVEESGLVDTQRILEMKTALETAISMVLTVSNFHLQRFKRTDDTADWIAQMTQVLGEMYMAEKLVVIKTQSVLNQDEYLSLLEKFRREFEDRQSTKYQCVHTFATYQAVLSKTTMMTVKELFILMLMLVRGVTYEKATLIQSHFKTPKGLIEFYISEESGQLETEKSMILVDLFGNQFGGRKITKAVLVAIYEAWGKK